MPIYEYHCDACTHDFEEWHKHADDIQKAPCPLCSKKAHRVISNTSFVLKGSGWYVTEYGGRKPEASSSEAPSAAPEKNAASSGKTETGTPTPPPVAAKEQPSVAAAS